MENSEPKKTNKPQSKKPNSASLRVKPETRKKVLVELAKLNKKPFGKRIKADALIARALSKLTNEDFETLQSESLSNQDRMEQAFRDYCSRHGAISKDEFLGKMLTGEVTKSISESAAVSDQK